MLEDGDARQLHFSMKHTLAEFAAHNYQTFLNAFSPPHGRRNLKEIWDKIAENLPASERFPFAGGSSHHPLPNGGVALVITMPLPRGRNEAYFIAAVPRGGKESIVLMLERSVEAVGGTSTMMIGMTPENGKLSRINFGAGPPPKLDAFVSAVIDIIVPGKPASPAKEAAPPKTDITQAIACVKIAGLDASAGAGVQIRMTSPGVELPAHSQPVVRVVSGGFGVMYAVDAGNHLVFVTQGDLADSGLSADALHEKGITNLRALTQKKENGRGLRISQQESIYAVLLDGNFEASLLLVDALWDDARLLKLAPNGYVIAIPSRDILAFCDAGSAAGIAALKAISNKISSGGDHLLTPALYRRDKNQWVVFSG